MGPAWTVRCAYPGCTSELHGFDGHSTPDRTAAVLDGYWARVATGLVCTRHNPKAPKGQA